MVRWSLTSSTSRAVRDGLSFPKSNLRPCFQDSLLGVKQGPSIQASKSRMGSRPMWKRQKGEWPTAQTPQKQSWGSPLLWLRVLLFSWEGRRSRDPARDRTEGMTPTFSVPVHTSAFQLKQQASPSLGILLFLLHCSLDAVSKCLLDSSLFSSFCTTGFCTGLDCFGFLQVWQVSFLF